MLDWLASCLCFHQPIVPKQPFLYGVPKAQRRLLFKKMTRESAVKKYGDLSISKYQLKKSRKSFVFKEEKALIPFQKREKIK